MVSGITLAGDYILADEIEDFLNNIEGQISGKSLYVGFVDGATYPDGTSVADVAIQNEVGDPAKNRPPRPFFRNAISSKESQWEKSMLDGLRAGYDGDNVMEIMGAVIAADIRESIIQLTSPALSPVTIDLRRNAKWRASQDKPVNMSVKPLEDTKRMLNSVTYELRDDPQ